MASFGGRRFLSGVWDTPFLLFLSSLMSPQSCIQRNNESHQTSADSAKKKKNTMKSNTIAWFTNRTSTPISHNAIFSIHNRGFPVVLSFYIHPQVQKNTSIHKQANFFHFKNFRFSPVFVDSVQTASRESFSCLFRFVLLILDAKL